MLDVRRIGAVGVVMGLVAVGCGDDGGIDPVEAGRTAGEALITLEPLDAVLSNPFMEHSLDLIGVSDLPSMVDRWGPTVGAGLVDPPMFVDGAVGLSGVTATGTEPGLYGGSMNEEVCDVDQLVSFLGDPANAAQAEAWAEAQGVEPGEVPELIDGLTPVRLRLDTRVTNHGFEDGEPVPFQSILQAGTAVLVDDQGTPRVKCFCGNPLAPPEPVPGEEGDPEELDMGALVANVQDAWADLDWAEVLRIEPGGPVDVLEVYDVQVGGLFGRPVGTTGDTDRSSGPAEAAEPPAEDPPPTDEPGAPVGDLCVPAGVVPLEEVVSLEQIDGTFRITLESGTVMEVAGEPC